MGENATFPVKLKYAQSPDCAFHGLQLGRTPLHAASWQQQLDAVNYLISEGANPNAADQWGQTPLIWAARDGHIDALRTLINNNADVNHQDNVCILVRCPQVR
jgi:ankyrin repeat protein